ncbi:hypothetical protein DNTS_024848 [Danionella cerebrum]|uniref:Uncharacterized protein n=1 Tax=Danionella cerebrum TaxID=2873325 RepID=A0A553QS23_9TELE|nr:hypothetical protein DNTS_024848 [Danionella translucida]
MDPSTGMVQQPLSEMNRRVSGFYNPGVSEERRGTQNSRVTLVDPRTGQKLPIQGEMQRSTAPVEEFRQGTEYQPFIWQQLKLNEMYKQDPEVSKSSLIELNTGRLRENQHSKWEVVSEEMDSQESPEAEQKHGSAPLEERRQGTEPSRRFLMDPSTGMVQEPLSEMNRRVSGFYNTPALEKRQGTEPSRRILMDPSTGMVQQPLSEMNRRVSGSKWEVVSEEIDSQESPEAEQKHGSAPVEERRQGTEPSRRFLMDLRSGMVQEPLSEMNRRVSSFYNTPALEKRQGTEPSRRILMDPSTGMVQQPLIYNPGVSEERRGTQNSRITLVDPRTGQKLPIQGEMQRSTAPVNEFRQGTEHQPHILQELRYQALIKPVFESHRQRTHA